MSSVVISNRNIINQKVSNVEKNKVFLPFVVSKDRVKKLETLLSKVKVTFLSEQDKLNISNLSYNNINIKSKDINIDNCRFTLSKTYVVTMKESFSSKVRSFYEKIVKNITFERPIFNISNETNLQEALEEATTEIDLNAINASLNLGAKIDKETPQVLANSPLGDTIIENPVNFNEENKQENNIQKESENIPSSQDIVNTPTEQVIEQPKVKVKKLKGNILIIPVILVWLGVIFVGAVKLVTNILT